MNYYIMRLFDMIRRKMETIGPWNIYNNEKTNIFIK